MRRLLPALIWLAIGPAAAERVDLGPFSGGEIDGWQTLGFDDIAASDYALVEQDGSRVLRGQCDNGAAVFGIEQRIDLEQTPYLHWSWRVDNVYADLDERTRAGDDFPARVYAVIDGGWRIWRTRAINYVWASREPVGAAWPNPFKEQAMMVVVESGPGGWQHEARNVQADFRRHFDRDTDHIDGIALMVDCDNLGGRGRAWFGDIFLSDSPERTP
ncbi:DUF3047 domain-containing protein [Spectribacter hydrogenoxidans]|uniref:DUF3047 domain-containing protein n=1 Tax=Spectribacter hydrogenoxidans TaxID=3075608 RepID=A0ABU3C0B1_9GAMM|nr:DUF3047 domain-containing protein [Salinisphaera sp. W335]MDT0634992.1 DUF3047 domain-containing protein [Salinisphaera sp. W335]